MRTAQIGASGVLLIQYRLLKRGIESAPMTTDAGIDLVVYAPKLQDAITVQVKSCLKPKPAGGKGRPVLDWWLPRHCPAQMIGLANLQCDQAWLFWRAEFEAVAQQRTDQRLHFGIYVEPDYRPRDGRHVRDFERYELDGRMAELFGVTPISN